MILIVCELGVADTVDVTVAFAVKNTGSSQISFRLKHVLGATY